MEQIHRAQQFSVFPMRELKSARVPSRVTLLLKSMLAFEPARRPSTHKLAAELRRCAAKPTGARRTNVVLAAAATLILVASASFVFRSPRTNSAPSSSRLNPAPRGQIIVPLPFENLSPEPDSAFWTHEGHDNVLAKLAEIADLKIISRTSAIVARTATAPEPFVEIDETVIPNVEQYRASPQIEKVQHRHKRVVYKRRLWDKLVYGWFSAHPYHVKKK